MRKFRGLSVLFVIPFLSGGGAERVVSIWANNLAELGYKVDILVFYRVADEYDISSKVNIHSISESKLLYKSKSNYKKILEVRKYIKKLNPNFVLPFISYVGIAVNISRIGLNTNFIETIRNSPWQVPNTKIGKLFRDLSVFFSTGCIVQNNEQLSYFSKIKNKKMYVVPNPLSNEIINNAKVFERRIIKNIVTVGRLEPQKNHRMLIESFANLVTEDKGVRLRIYGEGSLYNELDKLIESLKMTDYITLCGRTNDIISTLQKSDLFILTSNYEGMPNALMEAMGLGLPCISTNCLTGPSDLIIDGQNGLLIPVKNKKKLENSMKLLINNPEMAIKLGENARKNIVRIYSKENSVDSLVNVLHDF